ncbi:hypothetical protein RYX36_017756 [Vicia faba]
MANHLRPFTITTPYTSPPHLLLLRQQPPRTKRTEWTRLSVRASSSYLDMWKKATERERNTIHFNKIAAASDGGVVEDLEKKNQEFQKLLEVSTEERDRIQRLQVIDRASAAIAAARALLKDANSNSVRSDSGTLNKNESDSRKKNESVFMPDSGTQNETLFVPESGTQNGTLSVPKSGTQNGTLFVPEPETQNGTFSVPKSETQNGTLSVPKSETQNGTLSVPKSETQKDGIPGPDFWSWTPPSDDNVPSNDANGLQLDPKSSANPTLSNPVLEKERSSQSLSIPFESVLTQSKHFPKLPPLQSSLEVETAASSVESPSLEEEQKRDALSSDYAAEVVRALDTDISPIGVNPDGTRWWRETGIEQRPDGVICRWTVIRGVSADKALEWQDKFWEASDELGYKELGSEKSGRDAEGNVWREFWRESMRQENGLMHFEKTADKWGSNGRGDEWHEKWFEHYDASGQAEKWAHKWCSIDPNTPLDAGHAHIWHERWGETYDGYGASIKYTDKWAERSGDGGWEKWGDKWDENFDQNGHGVKQGETWWEGKYGERWNRTWGEQHNGSGWIHKYGKSSSGEHWDTHQMQDTWYERFPHFGFFHCFENSVQLREVQKPSERQEPETV